MPYDGLLLARARTQLEQIRSANQDEERRRREEITRRIPEIGQIDQRLRQQMRELVRVTLSKAPDMVQQLNELRQSNLALQERRLALLVDAGYPADYLDGVVSCPICRDSGMKDGRPCQCVDRLYNRELTKELGGLLHDGSESFEQFDLDLYSDQPDPVRGIIPREAMRLTLRSCRRFADTFPQGESNLLFQGGTGLGKTYMSGCIARAVAAKGCSVCYDSAIGALEAFERQRFARDPEEAEAAGTRVRRMLSCDLMILDDLGTEMLTSVTSSALYNLLNERLRRGKRTVISTNLSDSELQARYSPQIVSRLEGDFIHVPFYGSDIRLRKKKDITKTSPSG